MNGPASVDVRIAKLTLQLRAAERLTQVGIWELDIPNGIVTWSDGVFHTFGLDPASTPPSYESQVKLFEPESWERLRAAIETAYQTGKGYELVLQARRSDGAPIITVSKAEALLDDEGRVTTLVGTFQDITERENRERELVRVSDRLKLATSAAAIGVWEWDIEHETMLWDATMYTLYGLPTDAVVTPTSWKSLLHPDEAARANAEIDAALERRGGVDTTVRIVTPDGTSRHVRLAASVKRGLRGKPTRVVGVSWDVTQQVESERALRANDALQRALVLHAGPAMISTSTDGTIALFNPAAERLTGYSANDVIGTRSPLVFLDQDEVKKRLDEITDESGVPSRNLDAFSARARSRQVDAREWTCVRPDGTRVPVVLNITGIWLDSGELVGYLGVAIDLTTQKQSEHELVEVNRQLGVLLQEIHHRVKNNLQIIASLVNMQARQSASPATRAALMECRTRILTIGLIHEQLYQSKDYARIPFNLYAERLARNIVAANTSETQVRLRFDGDAITLPVESAIPCGLILNELITNAMKHAFPDRKSGTVTVTFKRKNNDVVGLCVSDDGIGLPPELAAGRDGSLGMNLVKDLCGQLGATVEVRTEGGTTFDLVIPASVAEPRSHHKR